ncbi:AraC family transcriptional regulator [Hoeflea prorocentri]|uniref:AraC family transcriptional regulator n=1 Tax=Hoeflea prorocentri TaxID=1922333 RepID=A0A9X3UL54_9HYPH|nr:AraC family transcriptional regulator [Hoeflea prorocentri]MCY6382430.1 AraC family transcriptional regulator [Hoeflea prorocentri]MDA5400230.1 AraC family transcriptional regulator [Hoeflea prorocentri]
MEVTTKFRSPLLMATHELFNRKFGVSGVRTLEDVGEFFSRRSGKYEVLPLDEQGYGAASLSIAEIDDIVLIGTEWNNSASSIANTSRDKLCINLVLNGDTEAEHPDLGKIVTRTNQARIASMEAGTVLKNFGNKRTFELAIPMSQLEHRARAMYGVDTEPALMFDPVIDLGSPAGRVISDLVSLLQSQAIESLELVSNPIVAANTKELVFTSVLNSLQHNYKKARPNRRETAVPRAISRVEDFMRSYADRPITVEMLAKEAGCSERALYSAFKEVRGTTPMSMLREIRLEQARLALISGNMSITACAIKFGFTNLGRFSKAYREKFGERPSETVRGSKLYFFENTE